MTELSTQVHGENIGDNAVEQRRARFEELQADGFRLTDVVIGFSGPPISSRDVRTAERLRRLKDEHGQDNVVSISITSEIAKGFGVEGEHLLGFMVKDPLSPTTD